MTKPIINLDDVTFDDVEANGLYTSSRALFSAGIGAKKLGYNLTVLPPGKAQCPFHCHHGEEEMFLVIEGEGELRFGDKRYPIRQHDVIACPTGGPDVAHQIINTGTTTLRYLAVRRSPISTRANTRTRRRCSSSPDSAASPAFERSFVPRTPWTTTTANRPETAMPNTSSRVTIHMVASLDGFIARQRRTRGLARDRQTPSNTARP